MSWLKHLLTRRSRYSELSESIREHLEEKIADLMEDGMPQEEATYTARREFGNVTLIEERSREVWQWPTIESILADVKYSLRMMRNNPAYTGAAFATLAIGITAMTLTFSIANAVLFKPLAATDPKQLVSVFASVTPSNLYSSCSYPDYQDIRNSTKDVFSNIAAYTLAPANMNLAAQAQHITLGLVSTNYFQTLKVNPIRGRLFSKNADGANSLLEAVITEKLWRSKFQSDNDILGKPIHLNKQTYTVIGVIGQEHAAIRRFFEVDVFVPAVTSGRLGLAPTTARNARRYFMLARLQSGVSLAHASAKARLTAHDLQLENPQAWNATGGQPGTITVVSERKSRVPPQAYAGVVLAFTFMVGMAGVLLLIVCSNIGNLALARALSRRKEIAIRLAIGSTRWRVVRQMLIESGLIATCGGLAAVFLAAWVSRILMAVHQPMEFSVAMNLGLDYRVFFFAVLTTFLTALVIGLPPALQITSTDISSVTKDGGTAKRWRKFSLRNGLIAIEVALTVVLLVPAGLFVRSLQSINKLDLGFDRTDLMLLSVDLDPEAYPQARGELAYTKILQHVRNLPDVVDASLSSTVPLSGQIEEGDYEDAQAPMHKLRVMSGVAGARYFETMRIPLLQGRYFLGSDTDTSQQVAIVNRAFVQKIWPGERGVGKYLIAPDAPSRIIEIVGIVQTGIYSGLGEASTPFLYRPFLQTYSPSVILQIRTHGPSNVFIQTLPREIEALLPKIVTFDSRTMDQQLLLSVAPFRAAASSLGLIALIALGLAVIGVYGIATYATARRTQEIGVRMALGATRRGIMWMIARQGVFLIVGGTLFGIPLAVAASFAFKSLLFAVAPFDIVAYSAALLSIIFTGILATLLPAMRASRINPMNALRRQ
jgi:putative ABC transport system permease protein